MVDILTDLVNPYLVGLLAFQDHVSPSGTELNADREEGVLKFRGQRRDYEMGPYLSSLRLEPDWRLKIDASSS